MTNPPRFRFRLIRIGIVSLAASLMLMTAGCGLIGATAMTAISLAPLKLLFACLPEGTQIDVPGGGSRSIETLRSGDLVVGYSGETVRILQVHGYLEDPEKTDFHAITFSNGSTVDLCGMHRIAGIRAMDLEIGHTLPDGLSVVGMKTYQGVERSYDILTEDLGYQVGGIPVNSMIEEMYQAGRKPQKLRE